jgi:hypothetical protein
MGTADDFKAPFCLVGTRSARLHLVIQPRLWDHIFFLPVEEVGDGTRPIAPSKFQSQFLRIVYVPEIDSQIGNNLFLVSLGFPTVTELHTADYL